MSQLDLFSKTTPSRPSLSGGVKDVAAALYAVQQSMNALYVALGVQADGTITLPTSDPEVVGQLWSNNGVVTISAGPA